MENASEVTGKVVAVKPKGEKNPMAILLDNQTWYSTFEPSKFDLVRVQKGDTLKLQAEKNSKGYFNIMSAEVVRSSPTAVEEVAEGGDGREEPFLSPVVKISDILPSIVDINKIQPFTSYQQEVLTKTIAMEDVDIKPSGEIYYTQMKYRNRLDRAFGGGGWALVPRFDRPIAVNVGMGQKEVTVKYALVVNGRFVAEAYGSHKYYPNNFNNTFADALESARSDSLKKCCKDIGIASECWDKKFVKKFMDMECIEVTGSGKGWKEEQTKWRRKDSPPFDGEIGPVQKEIKVQKVTKEDAVKELKKQPDGELTLDQKLLATIQELYGKGIISDEDRVSWIRAIDDKRKGDKAKQAMLDSLLDMLNKK